MGFYEGKDGPKIAEAAKGKTGGFKKGGGCMKKGGKVKDREARASGGGVFSSAMKGEPRGKTPKPY